MIPPFCQWLQLQTALPLKLQLTTHVVALPGVQRRSNPAEPRSLSLNGSLAVCIKTRTSCLYGLAYCPHPSHRKLNDFVKGKTPEC